MKIFITGGTGFIGTSLLKKLENDKLLLLVHESEKDKFNEKNMKNTEIIYGNLSSIGLWIDEVTKFKPDATIHMAWEGLPDYGSETNVKNLKYGIELFSEIYKKGCKKILCTGSCWEYGLQRGKMSEKTELRPYNAFTAAKNSLYQIGSQMAKERGKIFIWTRLFYAYGPGQRENSLIPYIIKNVKNNKKPEIKTLEAKNDFVYVDDISDALSMLIKKCNKTDVYNIGSGKLTSVKEIVHEICDYYNFDLKIEGKKKAKKTNDFYADISKIKKEIGWIPKTGIKKGIKNVIKYYEK